MRPLVVVLVALVAVLATRAASATGLCDPAGHFCIQVDTTSATVCRPLRPGGLNPSDCGASDGEVRKLAKRLAEATNGATRAVDALVARFDDLTATVVLSRRAAEPETGGDAGAREALSGWTSLFAFARPAGWLVEDVQPPTLSRVNGVQVARLETRLSSAGIGGAMITRDIAFDVRTRDAAYLVTFDAAEADAARLSSVADAAMATLDALPVKSTTASGEGLVWLVRGVVAALVLLGLAWLLGRLGRRRGAAGGRGVWPR
jgi:hypothetical protein